MEQTCLPSYANTKHRIDSSTPLIVSSCRLWYFFQHFVPSDCFKYSLSFYFPQVLDVVKIERFQRLEKFFIEDSFNMISNILRLLFLKLFGNRDEKHYGALFEPVCDFLRDWERTQQHAKSSLDLSMIFLKSYHIFSLSLSLSLSLFLSPSFYVC